MRLFRLKSQPQRGRLSTMPVFVIFAVVGALNANARPVQQAATTLNLTNLRPLALGRARNTCDQAGTTFQELQWTQGAWSNWTDAVQEMDTHPGFYFCLVSANQFKVNPDAISCP